ncbi:MAG: hypothetical protein EOP62_04150 [Sphingomonadales bacterium]|nr:MAG: hypothetical protein EOP62_04150 [Sphingomonadales bacterium]
MLLFETVHLPIGDVKRYHAPVSSPTLLALPDTARPEDALACASCPAASWNYIEDHLTCHCAARRYVSWLPKQQIILLCDDREAALEEQGTIHPNAAQPD